MSKDDLMALTINQVSKTYQGTSESMEIIAPMSLEISSGHFVSIIGPSGSGKSTLCNLIAGLETPDQGEILLDNEHIEGHSGYVGYMPQKDLLLPWRTLLENVTLGCEIRGENKHEARTKAREKLEQFGLGHFAEHYPHQLSGGMRQRAALLRTILFGSSVLLLDEPFGALDALTRREMQEWLLSIWNEMQRTVIFITHDIEEAILLSDEIIVFSPRPARIVEQIVIPFSRPRNPDLLMLPEALQVKKHLLKLLIHS
jgi:putative hydroxymethylpyrimidine transport system ATP-binding protein